MNLTSKDEQILVDVKKALFSNNKIIKKARGGETDKKYYFLQICDVEFYRFLLKIGLMSRKSLVLRAIDVPDKYFIDFLRGVIDGDGCISAWVNKANGYYQWSLRIVSAAPIFSKWLKGEIERYFDVNGKLYNYHHKDKKNPINILKFGKLATQRILPPVYYKDSLCLARKMNKYLQCLQDESKMINYGGVLN